MKSHNTMLLVAALLVVVVAVVGGSYAAYRVYYVQKSYYPMAGEVTIIDKSESRDDHYIVIQEATGEQFTLSCSESDYEQVKIGDTVNCERNQSIVTHKGEVHKIETISTTWD